MIIVGGNSMVGSRFMDFFEEKIDNLVQLNYPAFDLILQKEDRIFSRLAIYKGEILLHVAAFTDVDGAEAQRGDENAACWQLNVEGTRKLVKVAKKLNLKMVYISTDFVFDGVGGPYTEDDQVAKSEDEVCWYAWSKLAGEKIVQEVGIPFLIVRTSYPYRANFGGKLDFVRSIIKRLQENNLYPMFSDQFLTPTFIDNFAKALFLLVKEGQTGIWHVVDNTTLSAYQAAAEIAKVFGFDQSRIQKTSILDFQQKNPDVAKRPVKGGLKNNKLKKFLQNKGFSMQDFSQALEEMKGQSVHTSKV